MSSSQALQVILDRYMFTLSSRSYQETDQYWLGYWDGASWHPESLWQPSLNHSILARNSLPWVWSPPHGLSHYLNCRAQIVSVKGVLHLWALFLKTLCIFSKNKATSDKVPYGSGQKCSKELENYSFTSVETIDVKLQWKMCENHYFPCFEP